MSIYGVVKIVLTGDYATGKTTLKRSFMGETLDERYISTLGVNLATYNHVDEDMTISFQIWDLGGQDLYKKVRVHHYKGAEGCLLVFDKSREETFKHLPEWLEEISENITKTIPVILIGNKEDLLTNDENNAIDKRALEFIRENKIKYYQKNIILLDYISTCALKGINVEKAFLVLGREIIKKKSNEMLI